jgi:hypothetical protein
MSTAKNGPVKSWMETNQRFQSFVGAGDMTMPGQLLMRRQRTLIENPRLNTLVARDGTRNNNQRGYGVRFHRLWCLWLNDWDGYSKKQHTGSCDT